MVSIPFEPCFITRKLLQMTFSTLCTTTLKICSEIVKLSSDLFNHLSRKSFSGRINSDVLDTKIHTNNIDRLDGRTLRSINHNTEIERSSVEDQVCLTSDSIHPRSMILTNANTKFDSAFEGQNGNPIKTFPGEDTLIINDSSLSIKFRLDRLIAFIRFSSFRNGSDCHLGGDTKLFTDLMINNLLQFDFIGGMHFKSTSRHVITCSVKLMHSLKECLALFRRGFQFDLENLHHSIDIFHLWKYKVMVGGLTAFLPGIRTEGPDSSDAVGRPEDRGLLPVRGDIRFALKNVCTA